MYVDTTTVVEMGQENRRGNGKTDKQKQKQKNQKY